MWDQATWVKLNLLYLHTEKDTTCRCIGFIKWHHIHVNAGAQHAQQCPHQIFISCCRLLVFIISFYKIENNFFIPCWCHTSNANSKAFFPSIQQCLCDKLQTLKQPSIIFHSSSLLPYHLTFLTGLITYEIYFSFLWHLSVVSFLLLSLLLCISYQLCYYITGALSRPEDNLFSEQFQTTLAHSFTTKQIFIFKIPVSIISIFPVSLFHWETMEEWCLNNAACFPPLFHLLSVI